MASLPPSKNSWPSNAALPSSSPAPSRFPRISIVTPSYNQAPYIEDTIRSVLCQGYPNLEYIVMEDGSTDGSQAILEKYRSGFSQYVSGPNRGFGAVLHDGLSRAGGDIMAWLNSDDLYLPGALDTVARVFEDLPEVDWIVGGSVLCDGEGRNFSANMPKGFSRKMFFSGRYLGGHPSWNGRWIPQESVFWRRSLWEKSGARFLQERLQYGDFELWSRFWRHADLHLVPIPLGVYRCHPATYTSQRGNKSTGPCTELIEKAGEPTMGPGAIRWREFASRLSGKMATRFGEPAWWLEYDLTAAKWGRRSVRVL